MQSMMHRSRTFVVLALMTLTLPLALQDARAQADLITAKNPQAVLDLIKGYGSGELTTDEDGDPMVSGKIDGNRYHVYFYGCKNGKGCTDIQFRACWSESETTLDDVNQWNRRKRFGKAYLDKDNDPCLELITNLAYGVSKENLDDTIDWWAIALKEFKKDVISW